MRRWSPCWPGQSVGADSLSSANYGPEEAYKALHLSGHEPLVLWLALIGADRGGHFAGLCADHPALPERRRRLQGAARLVHPYAGLLSRIGLIVDYSLTIAISVAAATDAMFNLFPLEWLAYKPFAIAGVLASSSSSISGACEICHRPCPRSSSASC